MTEVCNRCAGHGFRFVTVPTDDPRTFRMLRAGCSVCDPGHVEDMAGRRLTPRAIAMAKRKAGDWDAW